MFLLDFQTNRTCPICRADASDVHREVEWELSLSLSAELESCTHQSMPQNWGHLPPNLRPPVNIAYQPTTSAPFLNNKQSRICFWSLLYLCCASLSKSHETHCLSQPIARVLGSPASSFSAPSLQIPKIFPTMHYLLLLFTGFHFYLVDLVVVFMNSGSPALEEVSGSLEDDRLDTLCN